MDVMTAAQAAAALAGMFLEIVQTMKHVIETMKGARLALVEIFTRAERIRLNLELFRSLTTRLLDPVEKSAALSFNESAYRQTANEVLELVRKVAGLTKRHDLLMRFNWLFYRSDVAALVKKLEERERDLGLVLTFIAAQSSVVTESEMFTLRAKVEERTKISSTFHNVLHAENPQTMPDNKLSDEEQTLSENIDMDTRSRAGWPNIVAAPPQTSPTLWLGVLARKSFTPVYLEKRDKLAEAAKYGDWTVVLESLEEGKRSFNESWSNAVRLRPAEDRRELSLWTPLHQAAYMRAPVSIISRLLEQGAFTKGEFQFSDITAVEIARELGYDEIYSILAPVVRHVLPAATLTLLQAKFDEFLRAELDECETLTPGEICLPPLPALTELELPEMWFPLAPFQKTFLFRLDGRELVVLCLGRRQPPSRQVFRITTTGWTAIQDAIITGL